jgi:hypothetical protein
VIGAEDDAVGREKDGGSIAQPPRAIEPVAEGGVGWTSLLFQTQPDRTSVEAELRVRRFGAWQGVPAFTQFELFDAVRVRPR